METTTKLYTKKELMEMDLNTLKIYWRELHSYVRDMANIIDFREIELKWNNF